MEMIKSHLICGNCGWNEMPDYEIIEAGWDTEEEIERENELVLITCPNCSVSHVLGEFNE